MERLVGLQRREPATHLAGKGPPEEMFPPELDDAGLPVELDTVDEDLSEPFFDGCPPTPGQRSWRIGGPAGWRIFGRTGQMSLNSR